MEEKIPWKKVLLTLMSPVYGREIMNALAAEKPCVKENFDRVHAKTALQRFFAHAKDEIVLLCRKLSSDVYENSLTIQTLMWAYQANKNLKITVFVRSSEVEAAVFHSFLLAYGAELHIGIEDSKRFPRAAELVKNLPDFCLVDGKHVRVEINKDTRAARLFINDIVQARAIQADIARIKSALCSPPPKKQAIPLQTDSEVCKYKENAQNVSFTVPDMRENTFFHTKF